MLLLFGYDGHKEGYEYNACEGNCEPGHHCYQGSDSSRQYQCGVVNKDMKIVTCPIVLITNKFRLFFLITIVCDLF